MHKEEKKDPFDGEYIGNIWGWKFSLFGLGLIVVLLGMILYRHYVMDLPFGLDPVEEADQTEQVEEMPQEESVTKDTLD